MSTVEIRDKSLWLDGERVALVSGELHYWRVPRSTWPAMFSGARQLGLAMLSSYTAWHVHEYEPARFDFAGETGEHTDLCAYLEAVAEAGFHLAIRPGPYIFAEWDNYGIPDHVTPYHRLHPAFKAAAAAYIREVCTVLRPFLATDGGPIVMLQADNMFDLGKDRYDAELGLLGGDGPFQAYLRDRYATIAALNDAWGTDWRDFTDVVATTALPHPTSQLRRRLLDYLGFRDWYTAECAAWTVRAYREHGIDVPIYSNATRDQAPHRMADAVDFMGINFYPTERYGTTGEHRRLLDDVRRASDVSALPYVAELHSGIWHGYHYDKHIFQPADCEYSLCNVLAGGGVGWNWYMLHDRDNWYMSPLNSKGRARHELLSVMRRWVDAEKQLRPWTWTRRSRTAITYHHVHHAVAHRNTDDQTAAQQVGAAVYDAGIDYTFFSLDAPGDPPELLFYDGDEWLSDDGYRALASYIEDGGHLVVFQRLPRHDEAGNVADPLDIRPPDGVQAQGYMNTFFRDIRISLGDVQLTVPVPASVYVYRATPGTPIRAALIRSAVALNDNVTDEYQRLVELGDSLTLTVGYTEQRQKGSLTVIGVAPTPQLVRALHRYLRVGMPAVPATTGVQTALYGTQDAEYLVALNDQRHEKIVEVSVEVDGSSDDRYAVRRIIGSGTGGESWEHSHADMARLPVRLDAKAGTVLEIRKVPPGPR